MEEKKLRTLKEIKTMKGTKKVEEKKVEKVEDLPGVGAATAAKLSEGGYNSLMSIAVASIGEIVEKAGVGDVTARKMVNTARDNLDIGFKSGEELLNMTEEIRRISTGSKSFDNMIGGGVESKSITEVYAQWGTGKSQIAHALAVNAAKEGIVVWIDNENTFKPVRIKQIIEANNLDLELMDNIKFIRAYNSDMQIMSAEKVDEMVTKEGLDVKLIIIDGIMSHLRGEMVARGQLAERQQKLNKHLHTLGRIADVHNIAVYLTNQVQSNPSGFFGDPITPVGGNILGHFSQVRIYLKKGSKGTRVARLVDSSYLADAECVFQITEKGIEDV